ncbi:AI-2E family transporter [Rhizosaccharibacter radicis]|uniref:AI-2E family transporter n=1 Tax=Rhizosaccharibacter radicis TaxID=2782605 RepID=A0ABT1VUJ7_9PROT|nr:AI-2E family transporter [Acetobacteraceae bacterium KSS12]
MTVQAATEADGGPVAEDGFMAANQRRAQEEVAARFAASGNDPGRRLGTLSACLLVLTVLAVFYTLYFTSEIVLPFVLAMVLNLLLSAPMRLLHGRLRLPKPLAAVLLIALLFGAVGAVGAAISVPASGWISRAPQSLPALQHKLSFLQAPIRALENGARKMQELMDQGGAAAPSRHGPTVTVQNGGGSNLASVGSSILLGTRAFLGQVFTMLLMLFFLLYEGDTLLRRVVEVMPTLRDKRRTVQIATEIQHNVSLYLATITVMNLLVGIANLAQCWALGLPNPLLWGVLAFLLNYIPIIGPFTGIVVYFFVGLFTFPSVLPALAPPAIYLAIHLIEGETITPMLLAKRFTLNPVLVMASLLFWDWLWGIPGAFLSVPLLAVFKIVCDHVDGLAAIGHVVGGAPRAPRMVSGARVVRRVAPVASAARGPVVTRDPSAGDRSSSEDRF